MFEQLLSPDVRQVFVHAAEQGEDTGEVGSDHLVLSILQTSSGIAYEVLVSVGVTYEEATARLAEAAPGSENDGELLAAIGIDLDAVRQAVEESFGPGALESVQGGRGSSMPGGFVARFSPDATAVLNRALRTALSLRQDSIDTEHLLLAILDQGGDGARLLAELAPGTDLSSLVRNRLRDAS